MTRCELYHGDCLEIAPTLEYTAVISDPPYGMAWNPDGNRFTGGNSLAGAVRKHARQSAVHDDDKAFDPRPWLDCSKVVLFGSNHFGARLPVGTTLTWIKRNPPMFGTFLSDAEIAWMKGGHGVYCYLDTSMNGKGSVFPNLHPTQKSVRLMRWCLEKAKVTPDDTVLDPYMGSGSTAIACLDLGIPFIGIEIDDEHFATAQKRVAEHQVQGQLFGETA